MNEVVEEKKLEDNHASFSAIPCRLSDLLCVHLRRLKNRDCPYKSEFLLMFLLKLVTDFGMPL